MRLGTRLPLVAAAMIGAALGPALAYSSTPADGTFTAVDTNEWLANGGPAHDLTIQPGQTVTFAYPAGASLHTLTWSGAKPSSCQGIPAALAPGASGSCTFDTAGTYNFYCAYHVGMTGRVIVANAPPPVATADPTSTPPPGVTATPGPSPGTSAPPATQPSAGRPPQTSLPVKLAAKQKGTRVRGSVDVRQAASRLEVTLSARLTKSSVRIGRYLKRSTAGGAVAFSVSLDAKARRALRSRRSLAVTVAVALTPPAGKPLTRRVKVKVMRG